jgi:Leishmanolysin
MPVEAVGPHLPQPRLPRTIREVNYGSRRRQQQQESLATPSITEGGGAVRTSAGEVTVELPDRWSFVHADASDQKPETLWNAIKQHGRNYYNLLQERKLGGVSNTSTSNSTGGSKIPFVDLPAETTEQEILTNTVSTVGANATSSTSVGFNVTVETEYNVTENVDAIGDNSTTMTGSSSGSQNDTTTVIYTTNEETNATNANSTQDGGVFNGNSGGGGDQENVRIFRPIRLRAFLSDIGGGGQFLSQAEQSVLLEHVIQPALLAWSAALRVESVMGNLTVDSHQLQNGAACGPGNSPLPSVVIPTSHRTTGVSDTDFILYISLAFSANATAAENMNNNSNANYKNDNSADLIVNDLNAADQQADLINQITQAPSQKPTVATTKNNRSQTNENSNEPNAQDERPQCTGEYLAASSFCSTDQFDRPTAALLHLCIGDDFFDDLPTNIMLVMHELGHALGFNSVSLAHFRRPDGSPITERDENGEIPLTNITCAGPVGQQKVATLQLPSEEILQFRTVRGGVRVAEVVTPAVRQVVRNQFDCQDLPGAELESGEFLPLTSGGEVSCIGDHWERRLFKTDLMNPLVDVSMEFNPRFSTITLAYFADSGWYQVDLSRASLSAGWGRAAGCEFVEGKCIQDGEVPPQYSSYFCSKSSSSAAENDDFFLSIQGCTPDLSRKASCSMDKYPDALPSVYQYFNFLGTNVGGNDPYMDYCPVYSGFANGLCSDSQNEALIKVNMVERFGQRNSRCLSGDIASYQNAATLSPSTAQETSTVQGLNTESTALCLPIACVVEDRSFRVQVNGVWEICTKKDQVIIATTAPSGYTLDDGITTIRCPDPIRVCPTFYCIRDCLGTDRICDYNVGKCVCQNSTSTNSTYLRTGDSADDYSGPCSPTESQSDDMFFYCPPSDSADDGLPSDDSPLADYYVPNARRLKQENRNFWSRTWAALVSGIAVFFSVAFGFSFYVFKSLRSSKGGPDNDEAPASSDPINPNKHKMIASIVVDMRTNDPSLRRRDALGERGSETDMSMTDTEASFEIHLSRELSLEPARNIHGTIADLAEVHVLGGDHLGMDDENEYIDPLAPPSTSAPIVRRRHKLMFSD